VLTWATTGEMQVRNVTVTAQTNKKSTLNLERNGVNLSSIALDGVSRSDFASLKLSFDSLTLGVTDGEDNTSTLQLKSGSTVLSSADITVTGVVTFADLSGAGKSVINGANITTGTINSEKGNTAYDLDNGTIRMGPSSGTRIEVSAGGIRQYYNDNLTGVIYSQYAKTYIGDNSRYTFIGWFSSGTPTFDYSSGGSNGNFCGIAIEQTSGLIHCNATKFEIPGRIECTTLFVNGHQIT